VIGYIDDTFLEGANATSPSMRAKVGKQNPGTLLFQLQRRKKKVEQQNLKLNKLLSL